MEIIEPSPEIQTQLMKSEDAVWKSKIETLEAKGVKAREFLRDVLAFREKMTGKPWDGYQP